MPWIKAKKNGNVFDVQDVDRARELVEQGHEGFTSDPRVKSPKAQEWDPDGETAPEPTTTARPFTE
jgi:hypothetical protein